MILLLCAIRVNDIFLCLLECDVLMFAYPLKLCMLNINLLTAVCMCWMTWMCCLCVQIEQVSQLSSLVESQLQYHKQAVQVLEELSDKLRDRFVQTSNLKIHKYKITLSFHTPVQPSLLTTAPNDLLAEN